MLNVSVFAISKKAQTNFHARAHHGLLNNEAGRLPPTNALYSVEICQWTCLLTTQLLKDPSGGLAGPIGHHDGLVVSKSWPECGSLAVAGASQDYLPCVTHGRTGGCKRPMITLRRWELMAKNE